MIDKELEIAYANTSYRLLERADIVLRVGKFNPELLNLFDEFETKTAAFVTAWNPFSNPLPMAENQKHNQKLLFWIQEHGLTCFEGVGEGDDGRWPGEESYLIIGIDRTQALELGKLFNQNAVIWVGSSAVPELLICV